MNTKNEGSVYIRVITKLPNSEQSYKGKVKTHKYINKSTGVYAQKVDRSVNTKRLQECKHKKTTGVQTQKDYRSVNTKRRPECKHEKTTGV